MAHSNITRTNDKNNDQPNNNRKFIGGAERARRNARSYLKRWNNQNQIHQDHPNVQRKRHRTNGCSSVRFQRLSKYLKPSERFFASILRSSVSDICRSNGSDELRHKVMYEACGRAGIPYCSSFSSTSWSSDNADGFFHTRASWVLEETRCILSEALLRLPSVGGGGDGGIESGAGGNNNTRERNTSTVPFTPRGVRLVSMENQPKTGFTILSFEKVPVNSDTTTSSSSSFTTDELYAMRPGCCFRIEMPLGFSSSVFNTSSSSFLLASIVPTKTHRQHQNDGSIGDAATNNTNSHPNNRLSLLVYHNVVAATDQTNTEEEEEEEEKKKNSSSLSSKDEWTIVPVTTLISQMRQFEACVSKKVRMVPFLSKLLSRKESTHIRFNDSGDDDDDADGDNHDNTNNNINNKQNTNVDLSSDTTITTPSKSPFRLPSLNTTQQRAANGFLNSQSSTLALVQGPPGTGKTTFLTYVVAKCLEGGRRVLVAAPTNKAIGVLAARFLDSLRDEDSDGNGGAQFNVAMIGVEDKLVPSSDPCGDGTNTSVHKNHNNDNDDPFTVSSLSTKLRRIFVYTWMESIVREFMELQQMLREGEGKAALVDVVLSRARRLGRKLLRSVPNTLVSFGADHILHQFVESLQQEVSLVPSEDNVGDNGEISCPIDTSDGIRTRRSTTCSSLEELISTLDSIDRSKAISEILATADVIFCTLSTAGASAMKRTEPIDDLLIDEAAAATEPEMCIPFNLGPTRLLAVGDPKQLPAMVVSQHAASWGLAKSMHERLMFDCRREYVMLDVQYRMNPSIRLFPSEYFYGGKLFDGANVISPDYKSNTNILDGKPYIFIQVEGSEKQQMGGSYSNADEASTTTKLVEMIYQSSRLQSSNRSHSSPWHDPDKIRIITFYQGQVALIRRMLKRAGFGQVLVATVDSSQGCEADIVIISFVRSNTRIGSVRHATGFLDDDRRMNVALTRARHQLVCVGNAHGTLSRSGGTTLQAIVDDAKMRNCILCPSPRLRL